MALIRFGMTFVPRRTSLIMQKLRSPAHVLRPFSASAFATHDGPSVGLRDSANLLRFFSGKPRYFTSDSDAQSAEKPQSESTAEEAEDEVNEGEVDDNDTQAEPAKSPEQIIEELNAKVKQHHDSLLRGLAEQENVRRIAKRDVERARTYAVQSFAKDLLDVADNLERARNSVPGSVPTEDAPQFLNSLLEGVTMTDTGLQKVFNGSGITKFGSVGDTFDPHIHEAMFQFEDEKLEPGTVGNIISPGYYFKDRVLRPAKVGTVKEPETTSD